MKIKVSLSVGEDQVKDDIIEVDDYKLEELTEEEIEESIEVLIRSWADRLIRVAWEVQEADKH
jgi:hypothetical protein